MTGVVAFVLSSRVAMALAILGAGNYALQQVLRMIRLAGQPSLNYDFYQYYRAGTDLARGLNPYTEFLTRCTAHEWCRGGYIYPTLLAELFRPLAALPIYPAAAIWQVLSGVMLAAAFGVMFRTVRRWLSLTSTLLLFALMISFLPIYEGERLWQAGDMMLLLLALAASAFVSDGEGLLAGFWLAVGAMVKITPVLLLPILVRGLDVLRRPRAVLAFAATSLVLVLVLVGLTPFTWQYFTAVLPNINNGTAITDNQSVPGLLLRFEDFVVGGRPPAMALLPPLLTVAVLGLTWWRSRGIDDPRGRAVVFAAFLAATPVITSITWSHHLVTEILVFVLLAPSLRIGDRAWWLAVVSYPLLWITWRTTDPIGYWLHFGGGHPHGPRIAGYLLFHGWNTIGMVLLWVATIMVLTRYQQSRAPRTELAPDAPIRVSLPV